MALSSTTVSRTIAAVLAFSVLGLASCDAESENGRQPGIVKFADTGDSVRIDSDGVETSFRLAYVEAPAGTNGQDSCLVEESATYLRELVPAGVNVEFEQATAADGSPTILLFDTQGRSVNASMLESGLAITAESVGSVPEDLVIAAAQARTDKTGLHSTEAACTVPSVFAAADVDVSCLTTGVGGDTAVSGSTSPTTSSPTGTTTNTSIPAATGSATSGNLRRDLPSATARTTELRKLETWITDNESSIVWRALTIEQRSVCRTTVSNTVAHARRQLEQLLTDIAAAEAREAEVARVAEEQRLAEESQAARVAEEQRRAVEAEAARVAEEQRLAEDQRLAAEAEANARAAEEERRAEESSSAEASRQAEIERDRSRSDNANGSGGGRSSSDSPGGSPSGGYPGYTGPRCYAPGGQTWTPC